tara:strand:- start:1965 stop:3083 length:1119 start_codon:yes stop_codon:yes gene_type:complete
MNTAKGLLIGCVIGAAAPVAAEEITASVWFPDTHPIARQGYVEFAKTLETVTGGDLTMQVYTGTAVLPPVAHLSGLTDGIVDMTYHAGTYTPSDLPEENTIASLAISLPNSMAATLAVGEFYLTDPDMQAMFERLGIVFLGSYATPQYILMCANEVATLDDIRGKKLRMPSPMHASWAESVGAVPVNVPSSEMFSGLEKGQIDCAVNSANDMKARSLWDVAKYTTMLELGPYFAGWLHAMSADAWQKLSEEHRQILLNVIPDVVVDTTLAQAKAADEAVAEAPDHNVAVIEPSENLSRSVADFVATEMDALSIATGKTLNVQDPKALVTRFQETYEKWETRLAELPDHDPAKIKEIFQNEVYDKIDPSTYGL